MKGIRVSIVLGALLLALAAGSAWAHFGVIIPSTDIVTKEGGKTVGLDIKFIHPMEGHYMDMARPAQFGAVVGGQRQDLLATLKPRKVGGFTTWQADYQVRRPGSYQFYVEPAPYWEPAEECYIVHYTKVAVGALNLEEGWDEPVGLKTEIIPLTRPYGLWTGNVFQGKVLVDGKPVPGCDVEVEYYNQGGKVKPPADPYVTQVVKTDGQGVFTYAMPRSGWWGFAALNEGDQKIEREGKAYPVEIGAVMWVHTRDMK
jgi:cobalt/nickel transport protein